jgi:hypothetical protein
VQAREGRVPHIVLDADAGANAIHRQPHPRAFRGELLRQSKSAPIRQPVIDDDIAPDLGAEKDIVAVNDFQAVATLEWRPCSFTAGGEQNDVRSPARSGVTVIFSLTATRPACGGLVTMPPNSCDGAILRQQRLAAKPINGLQTSRRHAATAAAFIPPPPTTITLRFAVLDTP